MLIYFITLILCSFLLSDFQETITFTSGNPFSLKDIIINNVNWCEIIE